MVIKRCSLPTVLSYRHTFLPRNRSIVCMRNDQIMSSYSIFSDNEIYPMQLLSGRPCSVCTVQKDIFLFANGYIIIFGLKTNQLFLLKVLIFNAKSLHTQTLFIYIKYEFQIFRIFYYR